jgi:hypothetical protein
MKRWYCDSYGEKIFYPREEGGNYRPDWPYAVYLASDVDHLRAGECPQCGGKMEPSYCDKCDATLTPEQDAALKRVFQDEDEKRFQERIRRLRTEGRERVAQEIDDAAGPDMAFSRELADRILSALFDQGEKG